MEHSEIWMCFGAAVAMFSETFLRGFQNKNVQNNHRKLAFFFGFLMTLLDGVVIHLVVQGGLVTAFFGAVGSAFGWVAAMHFHAIVMKKYLLEVKARKKAKRKSRVQKLVAKEIMKLDLLHPEGKPIEHSF